MVKRSNNRRPTLTIVLASAAAALAFLGLDRAAVAASIAASVTASAYASRIKFKIEVEGGTGEERKE